MPSGEVIQSIGMGGVGGLVIAVLTAWGIRDRLKKVEQSQEKIGTLVIFRDTCAAVHKGVEQELAGIRAVQEATTKHLDKRMDEQNRLLEWLVTHQNGGVRPPGIGG